MHIAHLKNTSSNLYFIWVCYSHSVTADIVQSTIGFILITTEISFDFKVIL